jgi:hypothetical protein
MPFIAPKLPFEITPPRNFDATLDLLKQSMRLESQAAAEQFERSKQYATLIITLGYAGIFGIWSYSTPFLPARAAALVGILAGLSVSLFCLFEILKMFAMQKIAIRNLRSLDVSPQVNTLEGLTRFVEERKRRQEETNISAFDAQMRLVRYWPYFFYPTVVTGYGALFLLMYNLFANLTKMLPHFPS